MLFGVGVDLNQRVGLFGVEISFFYLVLVGLLIGKIEIVYIDIFVILIRVGVDVNVIDVEGWIFFYIVVFWGFYKGIKSFVKSLFLDWGVVI